MQTNPLTVQTNPLTVQTNPLIMQTNPQTNAKIGAGQIHLNTGSRFSLEKSQMMTQINL